MDPTEKAGSSCQWSRYTPHQLQLPTSTPLVRVVIKCKYFIFFIYVYICRNQAAEGLQQ